MKRIRGYDRNQVLIGTLLGDAGLVLRGPKSKKVSLVIKHKEDCKEYLQWLHKFLHVFSDHVSIYEEIDKKTGKKAIVYNYRSAKKFYYMWKRFYVTKDVKKGCSGKKVIRRGILNAIDTLALAVWYMDDGSLSVRVSKKTGRVQGITVELYTYSFTEHENRMLANMLKKKFGLKVRVSRRNVKDTYYYSLVMYTKDALKFLYMVAPYVYEVECMRYKLHIPDFYESRQKAINSLLAMFRKRVASLSRDGDIVHSSSKDEEESVVASNMVDWVPAQPVPGQANDMGSSFGNTVPPNFLGV